VNIINRGLIPVQVAAGVVDKGGAAKYTGLHSLRHFYASWCINREVDGGLGLPAKVVQERLGHSSITVTLDTYGHLFPRGDDTAALGKAEAALLT
jgi:integrase